MNNVEKKLIRDFEIWRAQKNRMKTSREAIYNDTEEFMQTRFQIKPNGENQSISILEILDTMIAPDVDASVAANSVRQNVMDCQKLSVNRVEPCSYSCPSPNFNISGSKCFHVSTTSLNYDAAKIACQDMGAQLATISDSTEDKLVQDLIISQGIAASYLDNVAYIGLNDIDNDGTFAWQDGAPAWKSGFDNNSYTNWAPEEPNNGAEQCTFISGQYGNWFDWKCEQVKRFACSMAAEEACDMEKTLAGILHQRTCIQSNKTTKNDSISELPGVDIFLNPSKEQEKEKIVREKKDIAKNFFGNVNMQTLYPELFRILWDSTLPCFKEERKEEHMMLSCEVAGVEVNCSDLFIRVPTDTGMCCALNVDDSLRVSEYQKLVKEMQGEDKRREKIESQEGNRNGLRLILDLHSNTVSFGTIDQQFSAFSLFIGQPAQFPMMRDKSIRLQPGREHFIDLSATVVATNGIEDILPEARGCLFTDEGDLEFYKSYTFSNCRLECRIKEAKEKHKCVPWYLPKVCMTKINQEN